MSDHQQGPDRLGSGPWPGDAADPVARDRRRRIVTLAALGGAVLVVGGGALAASAFFSTGAQPAEALPASTLAYVSVDLDPSGGQKIAAINTLRKFPAFTEEVDIRSEDDLVEKLFEEAQADGECAGVDYADDVAPWLGSRAAFAAVDAGEEEPSPIGVFQVDDDEQAREGIDAVLAACDADDFEGGLAVADGWAVVAQTQAIADRVVGDAAEADLASDDDFQRWTAETGGDGFMTFYVAGSVTKHLGSFLGLGMGTAGLGSGAEQEVPQGVEDALEEFEGAAATVRFDDGGVEVEMAGSLAAVSPVAGTDVGGELVASLPADTVAAMGMGLDGGWLDAIAERMVEASDGEMTTEELFEEMSAESGLDVPDDVETLLGEGVAIALGSGIDPDAFVNGTLADIPVGIKIKGDAGEISGVLDKIRPQLGSEGAELLVLEEGGDVVAVGPHDGFRSELAGDGSLGDSAAFREVVDVDGAAGVVFVDFDADDDWLVRLAEDDPDASANLAPLSAFGVTTWTDGDVAHGKVRLTTD